MVQTPTAATRLEATGPSAEAKRREILAVASRLFRERGLHAAGMREIAAELGMTAGNLYYYFPSKQELLAYCQEATLDALLAGVEDAEPAPGARARAGAGPGSGAPRAGAAERLSRALRAHVVCLNETYPGSLAHLETEALAPERRAELNAKRKRYERRIAALVADGVASGELRPDVDPQIAAKAILGALNWTVKWYSSGGELGADEVGAAFAELFLDGLRAGNPSNTVSPR